MEIIKNLTGGFSGFYRDVKVTDKGIHLGVVVDAEEPRFVREEVYSWVSQKANLSPYKDHILNRAELFIFCGVMS